MFLFGANIREGNHNNLPPPVISSFLKQIRIPISLKVTEKRYCFNLECILNICTVEIPAQITPVGLLLPVFLCSGCLLLLNSYVQYLFLMNEIIRV